MRGVDLLGFAAAAAVLVGFSMNSILNLRMAALASNVLFVLYGFLAHIYPVVILHVILLPINLQKLYRIRASTPHVDRFAEVPGISEM
ncbi:YgjV family protein [Bradyrhizobium sp. LTSPM299]|uniref:YgjV family protein n=1 Tax=Bradyrhizobium sp. LTSPM299 TaxID=1619233 RepID=UPI0005CA0095|nr:YgjV family protein [Bradyrhizobium sp. LTSPM299]